MKFFTLPHKPFPYGTTFLSIMLLAVGITCIRVLTVPPRQPADKHSSILTIEPNLPGWELRSQVMLPINPADGRYNRIVAGKQLRYQRGAQELSIEFRDVQATSGDIGLLHSMYFRNSPPQKLQLMKLDRGSAYALTENAQSNLQSCIHANGRVSATSQEFHQNLYHQALNPTRLMTWLMGQHPLTEPRCLWVRISTNSSTPSSMPGLVKILERLHQLR